MLSTMKPCTQSSLRRTSRLQTIGLSRPAMMLPRCTSPAVAQRQAAVSARAKINRSCKSTAGKGPSRRAVQCTANTSNGVFPACKQPADHILSVWRTADAVCFDVDCTITVNDSLDLLAEFMGVKDQVAVLTNKAMDGTMNLEQALEERLTLINCSPNDIRSFIKTHPPASRLTPGFERLLMCLKARGIAIYLISGGFRELILPIARHLGIPAENVFANRMVWQYDDETGEPTRMVGFDLKEPTAHNLGKPAAIAKIRQRNPYNTVVMVGDGITDLEAVQETGGADLFIGYGGVVERQAVLNASEWFVYDWADLVKQLRRSQVALVGSGAWACAAMHIVAQNCAADDPADEFVDEVKMWVYEEDYQGRKLTEVINETHENPKYLPGVKLGDNVRACPDLLETVKDADVILFCAPHQFMHGICKQLRGNVKQGAIALSLTKGMRVRTDGPQLISQMVTASLGLDCSVLMGANIAGDIGKEQLSEAVIGYTIRNNGKLLKKLFETKYFHINLIADPVGAEMCGTLKNIVALAAGFIDGLDLGPNSKAAILREGLSEMRALSKALYPTVRDDTFFESCGMADLVASCYGGRNRLVAMEYCKAHRAGASKTFEELETELLNGQKLQGTLTSNEVQEILRKRGEEAQYPLFTTVNRIVQQRYKPMEIVNYRELGTQPLEELDPDMDVAPAKVPRVKPMLTV